jgi:hypothetical protein
VKPPVPVDFSIQTLLVGPKHPGEFFQLFAFQEIFYQGGFSHLSWSGDEAHLSPKKLVETGIFQMSFNHTTILPG